MAPSKVEVTVFDDDPRNGDWPEGSLVEVIAWFQAKLESIPEEYRASAKCEIASEGGYDGDHTPCIRITCSRPETAAETVAREAREAERAATTRARELETLRELQRKYGTAG